MASVASLLRLLCSAGFRAVIVCAWRSVNDRATRAVPPALCAPHPVRGTMRHGGCTAARWDPDGSPVMGGIDLHASRKFSRKLGGGDGKKKETK